jgi:hypothetical protein
VAVLFLLLVLVAVLFLRLVLVVALFLLLVLVVALFLLLVLVAALFLLHARSKARTLRITQFKGKINAKTILNRRCWRIWWKDFALTT